MVNCYKGKGGSFKRGSYKDLKLTDQFQKIAEGITEKLTRQQVGIDEMQFGFMPGCGATNFTVSRQKKNIYVAKMKNCTLHL